MIQVEKEKISNFWKMEGI